MSYSDIQALQSVGKAAQANSAKFILCNDGSVAWKHLKELRGGTLDIVLDNGALLFGYHNRSLLANHTLYRFVAGFEVSSSLYLASYADNAVVVLV
jgi:hypothetical protein